jgi:uncharacterized coiled-coil protein SlyX
VDNIRSTRTETLAELCEQAGSEIDSDKLQQLARKIVQKLNDRKYQKFDDPATEEPETAS